MKARFQFVSNNMQLFNRENIIMTAAEIKKIRLMLGMSQERLARELGVSFCTVNRWERGKTAPSPMAVEKLGEFKQRLDSTHFANRRSALRMPSSYPIRVEPLSGEDSMPGNTFESYTKDLGLGGLKFDSEKKFKPGSQLRIFIDFPMDDVPFEVQSAVKWTSEYGGVTDIGVIFDEVPRSDMDRLKTALLMTPPMH